MPKNTKHDFTNAKTVTVDDIADEYARVRLPDGATENWSLAGLPQGVKKGDLLHVRAAAGKFEMCLAPGEDRA